jgi:hypothetical protein
MCKGISPGEAWDARPAKSLYTSRPLFRNGTRDWLWEAASESGRGVYWSSSSTVRSTFSRLYLLPKTLTA